MKKVMFLSLILIFAVSTSVFAVSFSDLPSEHWAYEAVSKMADKGILSGYPDGSFKPNNPITRAEFAKILVVSLKLPEASYSGVADVPNTHWAAKYIDSAMSFMFGYEEDNKLLFKPEDYAVREDVAFAMARAMHLSIFDFKSSTLDRFSDKELISEDLRLEVSLTVDSGLMQGNADGTFNPKGYLTRAEVSQLIFNTLNKREDNSATPGVDEIDTLAIQIFNSRFEQYEGNKRNKYNAKELVNMILVSNNSSEQKINIELIDSDGNVINDGAIPTINNVTNETTFDISFQKDSKGYINKAIIKAIVLH